ncbi:hypothetical protein [Paenibacillus crassostreae]|uniref:Uncharacterized protein n=1 Tax=Paenibacillus crassostreae TaxID=1763538 RepID=A0A167C7D1_9BACL|nr:hypothetical protein [Paenibacillus crassostreae]AOZ91554.1 hypothetical protein LPB68_04550 [Paenibacillus crassostreae]OAB72872.1 hypothetical protein PNBC_15700 [Paenibacillus crassostreae]
MNYRVSHLWSPIVVICISTLLSGCNIMSSNKSPEEQFQLSLTGLAGIEALSFNGEAALRRNEQRWFEHHFTYEGQLTEHDLLSMQTQLSLQSSSSNIENKQSDNSSLVSTDLRRIQGGWVRTSAVENEVDQALARFNPLRQLEGIAGLRKSIQEEAGASRGTRVLRIELNPEDALNWLESELSSELASLNPQSDSSYHPEVQLELEAIWKQGEEQLQTMLQHANVSTVYHLTIERKSYFPLRLTSESNMLYLDADNNEQSETMVEDVVFNRN